PGPMEPEASTAASAAMPAETRAMPPAMAARGPTRVPVRSQTNRERTIQPARAPHAIGSSTDTSIQNDEFSGMSPSTGIPGTTPSSVPAGDTDVPVPSANPDPASQLADQTISVGR